MGQANDSGRHAELDENKERAAGRRGRSGQDAPGRGEIADAGSQPLPPKGKTGGAFGKSGKANARGTSLQGGGGGGGGGLSSFDHASPQTVGASKRRARKRT